MTSLSCVELNNAAPADSLALTDPARDRQSTSRPDFAGEQQRASYRIDVNLPAQVEWQDSQSPYKLIKKPGVIANLSGGGAQILLRHLPAADTLSLSLSPTEEFVEEWAQRLLTRRGSIRSLTSIHQFERHCERLRRGFVNIGVRIVHMSTSEEGLLRGMFALSVAFQQPHEGCFRQVRFLERQALQAPCQEPVFALPSPGARVRKRA